MTATSGASHHGSRFALLGIVTIGAVLRFWALDHGVPFALGPDEHFVLERALRIVRTGDFHPHFFDYPTLYIYVQSLVIVVRFLAGAAAGLWSTLDAAPASEFYLWGRVMTASIGAATIALAWSIARRFGLVAAVVAASLLAVDPMHVRESRYVLTDVPQTFLALLACLLSIRAVERPSVAAFVWSGVAVGLAAATKYTAAIALVMPLVALALAPGSTFERLKWFIGVGLGAGAAFLIGAPYTVLDLPGFLDGFATLYQGYTRGPHTPWRSYLVHLRGDLWWLGFALAWTAVALAVFRAATSASPHRAASAIAASFVLAYFVFLSRHHLIFGRYLLPLVPPLIILIGAVAGWAYDALARLRWTPVVRQTVFTAGVVAILLAPAMNSVGFAARISRPTTAALAYAWLLEHAPPGSRLAIESGGLIPSADRYVLDFQPRLVKDVAVFRTRRIDFVIASSDAFGRVLADAPDSLEAQEYRKLFAELELAVTFAPSPERPGPELRIFRVPPAPVDPPVHKGGPGL